MRFQPAQMWLAVLVCLIMVSGCRTFTNGNVEDPPGRYSLKDGPAKKRRPQSLEDLTGVTRLTPPLPAPQGQPIQDPAQFANNQDPAATGISLDQVSLKSTNVHVEALTIDDIQEDAKQQLPGIVESAVHPFSQIAAPYVSLGQAASGNANPAMEQPPIHPVNTLPPPPTVVAQQEIQPPATNPYATAESFPIPPAATGNPAAKPIPSAPAQQSQVVSQQPMPPTTVNPAQATQQPPPPTTIVPTTIAQTQINTPPPTVQSIQQPQPAVAAPTTTEPANQVVVQQQAPPVTSPVTQTSMMTMVAEPGSVSTTRQQEGSPTDRLFADLDKPEPDPVGDVVIVVPEPPTQPQPQTQPAQLQPAPPVAAIPASVASQTGAVQHAAHLDNVHQSSPGVSRSLTDTPVSETPNRMIPLTWDEQLERSIAQLSNEVEQTGPNAEADQQIRLMLLKLAAGENLPSRITINSQDPHYKKYWHHQLSSLKMLLNERPIEPATDAARAAHRRRRTTRAAEQLEYALDQLSGISAMRLSECAFATEVRGFGQFTPIQGNFQAGQEVLIYCEIENYSLKQETIEGEQKQVAELQGQYSIIDSNNRVVYQNQYQPVKDVSQRRRKDFYMFFPVTVPQMAPGQYRLQMSVDDLVGNKIASSREDLVFQVAATPRARTAATNNGNRQVPPANVNPPVAWNQPPVQSVQPVQPVQPAQSRPNNSPPANLNNMPLPINRPGVAPVRQANGIPGNQPLPINQNQLPPNYRR